MSAEEVEEGWWKTAGSLMKSVLHNANDRGEGEITLE